MNKTVNEVTAANVTERNLGHGLFETRTAIKNALVKLDKADTILSHWVQEYGFSEKPDPRAATTWSAKVPDRNNPDRAGEQAFKWYWEYNTIFNFVDMAFDYIMETQKILNEAMESEV
mgnify:CR=1 FL=1|jgi:hypothetical protein